MKHPFWIVNSALLLLVLLTAIAIRVSQVSVPEREEIQPTRYASAAPKEKGLEIINLKKIYEHDLFDTFKREVPPSLLPQMPALPEPPRDQAIKIPTAPEPNFLDPLDVTLKGIIVLKKDSAKNIAIISENKTGKEATYRIGDTFEDAQLVNIYANKAIFLRSNGQQEVLYLREQDAKLDPSYLIVDGWDNVITPLGPNRFGINPTELTRRVENLAQFIDILGLTSAYKKGKNVGCRIGNFAEKSLAGQLGLQQGDVITSVNNIPATTTENRLRIYKNVIDQRAGSTIQVAILRTGRTIILELVLQKSDELDITATKEAERQGDVPALQKAPTVSPPVQPRNMQEITQEAKRFAPTINDVRARERLNMVQRGGLSE